MNHKVTIVAICVLIVAAVVGGAVYLEWPTEPAPGAQPSPPITIATSTATTTAIATSSPSVLIPHVTVSTPAAEAAVDVASATPLIIAVNEPTDVIVTIQLTDSRLIPASVNLQRLDASGKAIAVLGTLNDSGTNGDAVVGDGTFTIRKSFTEATTTPVQLRVSWGLRGALKRAVSNMVTVEVWQRVVNQQGGYRVAAPPGWQVNQEQFALDGTIALDNFGSQYEHGGLFPPGGATIVITNTRSISPITDVITADLGDDPTDHLDKTEQISVNGIPATRTFFTFVFSSFSLKRVGVYVLHNGVLYQFVLSYIDGDPVASQHLQNFEMILNTVQFTS